MSCGDSVAGLRAVLCSLEIEDELYSCTLQQQLGVQGVEIRTGTVIYYDTGAELVGGLRHVSRWAGRWKTK